MFVLSDNSDVEPGKIVMLSAFGGVLESSRLTRLSGRRALRHKGTWLEPVQQTESLTRHLIATFEGPRERVLGSEPSKAYLEKVVN